ncbi:MAG TPA: ATP-binding protein, partial [Rhodoferax sp.]
MFIRRLLAQLTEELQHSPAVALLGPRQAGKTTLALEAAKAIPSIYLDLESERDRAKLAQPELYLADHLDKLVILDEVHRTPHLFPVLRGLIDQARRSGRRAGNYLLLGSAALDLLQQSGETLAGRIAYLELGPLNLLEVGTELTDALWLRGGFPESLTAPSDARSLRWRQNFIRTYLERDVPQFGPRIAADTLRRFWIMLAHNQSGLLNVAQLARNMGVDAKTAQSYIDLLCALLLVRRLPPWHANMGKRLVKSPKVYVRDSWLVHALLDIET